MEIEKRSYKNPVVFLRKSEKGEHLYAFNRDGILGGEVQSLIMNISEVDAVINGAANYAKISVINVSAEGLAVRAQQKIAGEIAKEFVDKEENGNTH